MAGAFGYELDLTKLNEEERALVRRQVADYHKYYNVIQNGDYYRLINPWENRNLCAWESVSPNRDEALLTAVVLRARINPVYRLRFRGLDPEKKYREEETGTVYSGDTLMNAGIMLTNRLENRDFATIVIYLKAVSNE